MNKISEIKQLWYISEFDSHATTMIIKCKICKKDLTSQAIKLLEGKIKEIKCKCKLKK